MRNWDGTQQKGVDSEIFRRVQAIALVCDTLLVRFGGIPECLMDCGVTPDTLSLLKRHMLDERG